MLQINIRMECPREAKKALKQIILIGVLILVYTSSANAGWDDLLEYGQQCSGLPEKLLLSVILVESSGYPYAINVNYIGSFYPSSVEDARNILSRYSKSSMDIGLMQINWNIWKSELQIEPVDLLDPYTNVCIGSRILRQYIDMYDVLWKGVGRYHAVNVSKQIDYASRVFEIYRMLNK